MYFKVFRAQSWGKKTIQDKTGVFRGALQFVEQFTSIGHSEPVRTLAWESPALARTKSLLRHGFSYHRRGLPHQ